jgi:hypothetical protein
MRFWRPGLILSAFLLLYLGRAAVVKHTVAPPPAKTVERAAFMAMLDEADHSGLNFLDQGQDQEYRDELASTAFGRSWLAFFKVATNRKAVLENLRRRYGVGNSNAPIDRRTRALILSDYESDLCSDFVLAHLDLYRKDYARLQEIQNKHRNRYYWSLAFPTLDAAGRPRLAKFKQDVSLLAYSNRPPFPNRLDRD